MINRGSLGCKWSSFKKMCKLSVTSRVPVRPLQHQCKRVLHECIFISLQPIENLLFPPESCLLGGGSFRCWITRLRDLALHPPSGGETAMQPPRYYDYFLNPLRPVKGYSRRDRSSARLSAQVWRWNDIKGHVERRPQVQRGACVRIKSRLLQILPRML